MTVYEIGAVALFAALGAGAAYLAWRWAGRRLVALARWRASRRAARKAPAKPAQAGVQRPSGAPGTEPPLQRAAPGPAVPSPEADSQFAALRDGLATIARSQIALLEGRTEQESRLLGELRAVLSVPDPEQQRLLAAIDAKLTALAGGEGRPGPDGPQADPVSDGQDGAGPDRGGAGEAEPSAQEEHDGPPFGPVPAETLTTIQGGADPPPSRARDDDTGERLIQMLERARTAGADPPGSEGPGHTIRRG